MITIVSILKSVIIMLMALIANTMCIVPYWCNPSKYQHHIFCNISPLGYSFRSTIYYMNHSKIFQHLNIFEMDDQQDMNRHRLLFLFLFFYIPNKKTPYIPDKHICKTYFNAHMINKLFPFILFQDLTKI